MNQKYIISSTAFGAAKKHNAILEAQTNTAQFIRDDNGKRRIIKQQKRLLASKDRVIFAQKAFYEAMLDECHNQHAHR